MNVLLLITILFPILGGLALPFLKFKDSDRKQRNIYSICIVLCTSLLILSLFLTGNDQLLYLFHLGEKMDIAFRVDSLSCVFLALIAILWPIATTYAFEYMEHEGHENRFFMFYIITYGVVIGLATSANLITFYLMYECLTFVTLPLVMHAMDKRAINAGKRYFRYSIFGAALAFVGIMFLYMYGSSLDFTYGGILDMSKVAGNENLLYMGYLFAFFGFGVKAAIFPFHSWLPSAGVAPTPVTALLHAVAVVKAGVFAIMRVTFYSFGTSFLLGSWAQYVALSFACFTIVFGSAMALKQQHLKRRLAYSTISNLSYILVGVTLMTTEGLAAALAHMFFHGIMKICLFFCVGVVNEKTHKEYVYQIEGFGRKMPITFGCFTVGACALSGIPLFAGFVSKAALGNAAIASQTPLGVIAVFCLLVSALLTTAYTFEIVIKAFFVKEGFDLKLLDKVKDPKWFMKGPLVLLSILMLVCGIFATPIMNFFVEVASHI